MERARHRKPSYLVFALRPEICQMPDTIPRKIHEIKIGALKTKKRQDSQEKTSASNPIYSS